MAEEESGQSRIAALARPKPVPLGFQEDRRSVYWVDYIPPKPGPDGVTVVVATPRVQELARHKEARLWRSHRPTPIWPVSSGAQSADASERIISLSLPKSVHSEHQMERSPYMYVSQGARQATCSGRLEMLSEPKKRPDISRYGTYETQWGEYEPVSTAAKKAQASERLESLAYAKGYHKDFQDERPIQWDVSSSALKSIASLRIQQMARPRSRTMIKDDYDPYKVPLAARKARATPRLEELCVPIPRKIRQKRVI